MNAASTRSSRAGVDVGEVQVVAPQHPLEQPERAAVGVVGDDDVVAGLEARGDGADGGHARGKREAGAARLQRGDVGLERGARRVLRARVFVALVLAERVLDVGRGLVDRRDDGAGRRVGLLAGVDAERGEARGGVEFHVVTISLSLFVTDPSGEVVFVPRAAGFRRRAPRRSPPGSARARGNLGGPRRSHRRLGQACVARQPQPHRAGRLVEVVGSLGTLALLVGLAYFVARLISLARQHLLWRVRRKLIISYILVGLVPALLIITFGLVSGLMLFGSVSQYIVTTRVRTAVEQAQFLARTCAIELARLSGDADVAAFLDRKQAALATRYPGASLAMVPVGRTCPGAEAPAGRLAAAAPRDEPAPGRGRTSSRRARFRPGCTCGGFAGLVAYDVPRHGGAGRRRNWRCARPCSPTARAALCRRARPAGGRVDGRADARRDRHRAARHLGHRSRPAAGAQRRAAGGAGARAARRSSGGCSRRGWRCSTSSDWETGRIGAGDAVDRHEHRRDLQPAVAGAAGRDELRPAPDHRAGRGRRAVPVHPVRRADVRPRAGAVHHRVDPRAVCRHRAGPEAATSRTGSRSRRATSWASSPTRSTR